MKTAAQLVLSGQPDQFGVGHRRPQEVGQARGQRVIIQRGIPAWRGGFGRFLAEEEPGRGEDGGHRLGHAGLEGPAVLGRDGLGQRREPVFGRVVHGASECFLSEPGEDRTRGGAASGGVGGEVGREEAIITGRLGPVPLIVRPSDRRRLDAE